jgi:hypothetical protein
MNTRFVVSLWRIGRNTHVSFTEYDEHRKLTFRTTYPLTYAEACDFGHWASNRAKKQGCEFYLCGDGWEVHMPICGVIQPDLPFHPIHSNNRLDTKNSAKYAALIDMHYSLVYATD